MSKRSIGRMVQILSAAALACTLGACAKSEVARLSYAGPGWYLEKPKLILASGPQIFGGPFTYDQCELKRKQLPESTAELMLCNRELVAPGPYGPY
jgi:hypothetical protein